MSKKNFLIIFILLSILLVILISFQSRKKIKFTSFEPTDFIATAFFDSPVKEINSYKDLIEIENYYSKQAVRKKDIAEKTEKFAEKKFKKKFKRTKLGLIIYLKDKKYLLFTDKYIDNEKYSYYYFGFLTYLNSHLLKLFTDNDEENLLINFDSGAILKIGSIPIESPDKNKFMVITLKFPHYFVNNYINIFQITPSNTFKELFSLAIDWEPRNPKWLNNNQITIEKYQLNYNNYQEELTGTVKLNYADKHWQISE